MCKHHCYIHPKHNPLAWLRRIVDMKVKHLGFLTIIGEMVRHARHLLGQGVTALVKVDPHTLNWQERSDVPLLPDEETYRQAYNRQGVTVWRT